MDTHSKDSRPHNKEAIEGPGRIVSSREVAISQKMSEGRLTLFPLKFVVVPMGIYIPPSSVSLNKKASRESCESVPPLSPTSGNQQRD